MKRRDVVLAAAAVAIGAFALAYHGPGRWLIRGHVGDAAATMFVFAVTGLTRWRVRTRAVATLSLALGVELLQAVWHGGGVVVGTVADPWDLVAYAVGVVVGIMVASARRVA